MPKPDDPQQKPADPQQKPVDPQQKPADPQQKPADQQQKPADPASDPFEGINARLASMEQAQSDMMKAISALANQGAVNKSIDADNGETDDDEYPDIDLDSINRLIGD